MDIKSIYFTDSYIIGIDESGKEWPQSLLWYPGLMGADNKQRDNYEIGLDGFHWRNVDEDISFESFFYDDAEPSPLQHFFLTHKEIKISEFAKVIGIDASLLRNYINGFKKAIQGQRTGYPQRHTCARASVCLREFLANRNIYNKPKLASGNCWEFFGECGGN